MMEKSYIFEDVKINCGCFLYVGGMTFFFFFSCAMRCGILVPRPGIELVLPALETQSLNHWSAREFQ